MKWLYAVERRAARHRAAQSGAQVSSARGR